MENIRNVLGDLLLNGDGELPIPAEITTDSRKAAPGSLFIAVPGEKIDGNDFIADAVARGVSAVIHTRELADAPPNVAMFRVSDAHAAASRLWRARCGAPDAELRIFGVTGTNGKTTTAYLLRHLLNAAKLSCGLVSTVEYDDCAHPRPPTHTTPDPWTLFPLLADMRSNGAKAAAMEFSSHSLAQRRLDELEVFGAIFTNLTGDHLDFHHDMEHYYQAKKSLFTRMLRRGGYAAINLDDAAGRRLAEELRSERPDLKVVTFGTAPESGWRISEPSCDANGCRFVLSNAVNAFDTSFDLTGEYNIHNLAGTLTLLLSSETITPDDVDRALFQPLRVPGRLDRISVPGGATFYVDYAHTDDALINVLGTLKPFCAGRLFVVFGAGGDRDRTKRPRMGKAAAQYADFLWITSDNPRSERPEAIIEEIIAGVPPGTAFRIVPDRREALALAVKSARENDIVLVAGKGHENYQEINGVRHPFDDREVLLELLSVKK